MLSRRIVHLRTPLIRFLSDATTFSGNEQQLSAETFSDDFDSSSRQKVSQIVNHFNYLQGREYVPSTLSVANMKHLLTIDDYMERERYFYYLYITEIKKRREGQRKRKGVEESHERRQLRRICNVTYELSGLKFDEERGYEYGLWKNSMFARFNRQFISKVKMNKLCNASLFGQNLVFDFSFEHYMNTREIDSLCRQLQFIHLNNLDAKYPFNVWFTNYQSNSYYHERLIKLMPTLHNQFINLDSKSAWNLFPSQKLIYLSPDAEDVLWNYDHEAVYVIGCIVDTIKDEPFTYNLCKERNIKCVRFPLDECVEWFEGAKDLPLNQVFDVLMKLKTTNNWRRAVKKVSRRKWNRVKKVDEIFKIQFQDL